VRGVSEEAVTVFGSIEGVCDKVVGYGAEVKNQGLKAVVLDLPQRSR